MNPHQLVGLVGPANEFAMNGLAMHFACILIAGGHTLLPVYSWMYYSIKPKLYENTSGPNILVFALPQILGHNQPYLESMILSPPIRIYY